MQGLLHAWTTTLLGAGAIYTSVLEKRTHEPPLDLDTNTRVGVGKTTMKFVVTADQPGVIAFLEAPDGTLVPRVFASLVVPIAVADPLTGLPGVSLSAVVNYVGTWAQVVFVNTGIAQTVFQLEAYWED